MTGGAIDGYQDVQVFVRVIDIQQKGSIATNFGLNTLNHLTFLFF